MRKFLKIFLMPGKIIKLMKEVSEAFIKVKSTLTYLEGKFAQPEVKIKIEETKKEIQDVFIALSEFTGDKVK